MRLAECGGATMIIRKMEKPLVGRLNSISRSVCLICILGYKSYMAWFSSLNTQMDSFTYIDPTQVPTNSDGGGSGGNAYCVVAHTITVDTPTNMEGGGSGGNAYCVIA